MKRNKLKDLSLFLIILLLVNTQFCIIKVIPLNPQSEELLSNESTVPPVTWNKTYNRFHNDLFYSALETPKGELIFLGRTEEINNGYDFWLVKTDANGEIIWEKIYSSEEKDVGNSVIQTDDGNFLLAGYTYQHGSADGWLIKTNSEGDHLWNKTYGHYGEEFFNEIIQTNDGGFCIAGCTSSIAYGADFFDGWIVKINASGDLLWSRNYGGSNWDEFYSIIQTPDGGYLLAGDLATGQMPNPGKFWVLKTDSVGLPEWNVTISTSQSDFAYSVIQTIDDYVVAGRIGANGYVDCYLVKINHQGIIEWNRTYGGEYVENGYSVVQTHDGGYALLGITDSFGEGSVDLWLIKTDNDGNELWNQTFGTVNFDYAYKVLQTRDNGLLIIGRLFGVNHTAYVLKIGGSIYTQSPTFFFSNPLFLFIPLILLYFTRKKRFF